MLCRVLLPYGVRAAHRKHVCCWFLLPFHWTFGSVDLPRRFILQLDPPRQCQRRLFSRHLLPGGQQQCDSVPAGRHVRAAAPVGADRVPGRLILPLDGPRAGHAVHGGQLLRRRRPVGRDGHVHGR